MTKGTPASEAQVVCRKKFKASSKEHSARASPELRNLIDMEVEEETSMDHSTVSGGYCRVGNVSNQLRPRRVMSLIYSSIKHSYLTSWRHERGSSLPPRSLRV